MANLLSNTTIGGYQSIHTGNIGSYALTSVPANVITTSGGQTIAGTTYFSGGESLNVYGIRGRFTNEYMHLYYKVGIGHPGGWGQGEGNTPGYGLSTYGGANFAYGNNADSTFNGIVYSTASFRAPIFYDSNDTNYYGDFASTSRLNIAHVNSVVDQSYSRIVNPQGGQSLNNNPQSGAIKIKLPVAASFTNSMMSFTIQIYNYQTGTSRTIRCGGYTYNTTDWYNTFAFQIGDTEAGNLTIRFGKDSTGACVWIGETNSYWDYPNVFVTDVQSGHSQPASMATGWSITMVTSFDTIQTSRVAYSQITSGNIASQSVSYATTSGSANSVAWTNVSGRPTNVSSFTNDSGYLTSLPSHNHDDRYFTETESDGRFQPLENQRVSTSSTVRFSNTYTTAWFRNDNSNTGLYNEANGNHFYSRAGTQWGITFGGNSNGSLMFYRAHESVLEGQVYFDTSGFGLLNRNADWAVRSDRDNTSVRLYYSGGERVRTDSQGAYVTGRLDVSNYIYTPQHIIAKNIQGPYQVLNLDTIKEPGLYQYDGGIGGTQPAGTDWYNVKTIEIGSDGRYSQFVMPYSNNRVFYRSQVGGTWLSYVELITSGNIGSQSVSYANSAGSLTSMNISQFTNNSGYLTSLPSHNHDDRYYTESEIDSQISNRLYQASVGTFDFNAFNGTGLYRGSTGSWSNRPVSGHNGGAVLQIDTHPGNYHSQLYFDTGADRLYLRNANAGSWGGWNTILHSGNHTSYSPSLTGGGASGTWSINVTGSAGSASSATTAINLNGLGSIQSTSTGTSYTANYQVRENAGGSGNTNEIYAPQLAFHWGGVVASSIMMESSGRMAIRNNPGGSYENFIAAVIYSSGYGDSTQWNTAYSWGNHASAGYQAASTAITTSNIGSQSVSYASTAGNSATTSQRSFDYIYTTSYLESAGAVYGTIFYDNNDRTYYGDFNGTSKFYQAIIFGDSTRYSAVSTTINGTGAGDKLILYGNASNYDARVMVGTDYDVIFKSQGQPAGKGMFRFYSGPSAALAMEIRADQNTNITGTIYSAAYRGNANVGGTGEAAWFPAGLYAGSTMWQYGSLNKNNTGIYDVSEIKMYGGLYLQTYNDRNLIVKGNSSSDAGIEGRNAAGSNVFQIYGNGSDYGFLNGTWASWDIRKTKNGAMYMNNNDSYYLQTNSTSNFVALNIQGNAVVHAGNIGSQSVTYATNSTRLYASDSPYTYGGGAPYYLYMNYDGGSYWELKVSPATPGAVRVAYSNVSGSTNSVAWTNVSSRPTALSQFTNDLGNYGGWLTSITAHSHAISDVSGLQTALDGKQAAGSYAASSHNHDDRYYTESESDTRFARRDADSAISGNLVIGNGTYGNSTAYGSSGARLMFSGSDTDAQNNYYIGTNHNDYGGNYSKLELRWHTGIRMGAQPGYGGIRFYDTEDLGTVIFSVGTGDSHVRVVNNLYVGGNLALHAGNYNSYSPTLTGGNASGTWGINVTGSAGSVAWTNVSSRPTNLSQFTNDLGNYGGWQSASTAITTSNIGSQSVSYASTAGSAPANGGNSSTVGGYAPSGSVGANTVVIRDANNYIYAHYINSNVSESENPTINSFYTSNGDGWLRKSSVAHVKSQLGLGSMAYESSGTYQTVSGAINTGNIGSQSVSYATTSQQLTKFGDIYGQDWNSYYINGKMIVSSVYGGSGPNFPTGAYNYGAMLSYGVTGSDFFQVYFPENGALQGGAFRKLHYRTGWNGSWSAWKSVVDQEGQVCTIAGSNQTGIEIHSNVGYNQDPLTYFLMRGQADTSWKALKVRLTGDAGGQDIEFRRIAENGADSRMWYVPRGANTVNFEYPIVQPSDSRLKDNLTPISTPVDKIKSLRGVEFDWNSGEQVGTHDVGLIAQDVEAVLPEAVTTQEDGYKNLAYTKVIPLLVEAMKEQQAMIEALRAEIELLKNK